MTGPTPSQESSCSLVRVARFRNLRALAWSGDQIYASRGYQLLRARIERPGSINWEPVGEFRPALRRRLSIRNRLTARLFRDGFHALAILPSGALVGAVPGAVVTLRPNETQFRTTHAIIRGTRPLHITPIPSGAVFWGEYFDNPHRDAVHIHASTDGGEKWSVAYTFPKGAIRHVHNIVHDPWENCLWVLTGDDGDECRILRASLDFSRVDAVLQGNQQARAVALVPTEDGLYFSSDTPLEANYVYHLDRAGRLRRLTELSSSSIYGCRVRDQVFFATMVEPSEVNRDSHVRIYGGSEENWTSSLAWKKDRWNMRLFQYGNAFLPGGNNTTNFLAVTTIAVEGDDMTTSLYSIL
jgi:hypothetical protein